MFEPLEKLLAAYKNSVLITQDEYDNVDTIAHVLRMNSSCFERVPGGHITASAWVMSPDKEKVLLTHHKKLQRWLQLGGHCDGNKDVKHMALQEAQEESGITEFTFLVPGIFDVDIHALANTCAFHYDIRFLLHASTDIITVSEESLSLAWVPLQRVEEYSAEESMLRMKRKYSLIY
jgi:hypothetical protein